MSTAIVFSCLLYVLSLITLPIAIVAAPCCAFLGMLVLSMAKSGGYPLLPFPSGLILGWLFVTVLVTVVTLLQPRSVRETRKGIGYFMGGAVTGMAIGLLGFSITTNPGALYAIMIITTAVGTILGYLMFTRTPDGANVRPSSGHFFSYMLAKGFPTAITVMQLGVVLVLIIITR